MTSGYTISKMHNGVQKPIEEFKNFFHPQVSTGRLYDFGWVVRDAAGFIVANDDDLFADLFPQLRFPNTTGSVIKARHVDYGDREFLAARDSDGEWIPLDESLNSYKQEHLVLLDVVNRVAA